MTPSRSAPSESIISHGLINQAVKLCDVICVAFAGLISGLARTPTTLTRSLLLSMPAIFLYKAVGGNRPVYRWDRYHSLRWETAEILTGLAISSAVIWVFAQAFHPESDTGRWLLRWMGTALPGIVFIRVAARLVV